MTELSAEQRERVASAFAKAIEDRIRQLDIPALSAFAKAAWEGFVGVAQQMATFLAQMEEADRLLKIPIGMLADIGWYPSMDMSDADSINAAILLKQGKAERVTPIMISLFKQTEKEIEDRICARFPTRTNIIKTAFRAHRRQEYELSIPIMLVQADGICRELINAGLFSKAQGIPKTFEFAEQHVNDIFFSAMLEPLRRVGVVSANTSDLPSVSRTFNRHGILHGIITDYATEENSYKAISLLSYISDFVFEAREGKTT